MERPESLADIKSEKAARACVSARRRSSQNESYVNGDMKVKLQRKAKSRDRDALQRVYGI